MTTYSSKIKAGFNLDNIKTCLEEHNTKGRGTMLDLVGTLASVGLMTKEVSYNQWVVTNVSDAYVTIANLDFQGDCITITKVAHDTGEVELEARVFTAENIFKTCYDLEYAYRVSHVNQSDCA